VVAPPPTRGYRACTVTASLAAWFARFPEGWWGYHWAPPEPMSVVQIVGSGTLDLRLMAMLWAVVSRRRSVMLASEAPQAGKTTTLSAMVDFLPAETVGVFLRGSWADYRWTDEYGPDRTYLLINEMSDHLPIYVWGRNAKGALELTSRGYGLGATMHADSLDEAIESLRHGIGATDSDLADLTIYLQFSAYRTPAGTYRRCEEAWHLRTDAEGALAPIRLAAIEGDRSPRLTGAQRLPVPPVLRTDGGRRTRDFVHEPSGYAALAATLGLGADAFERELEDRSAYLARLADEGICEPPEVAAALAEYADPSQRPDPSEPGGASP